MNKHKAFIFLLVAAAALLQCTFFERFAFFSAKPDLLLILVLFYSLSYGSAYAFGVGALCGLFLEATSGIPPGFGVVMYALSGIIVARWVRIVYVRKISHQIISAFIFTLFSYSLLLLMLRLQDRELSVVNSFALIMLPASLYTAICTPPLFYFLNTASDLKR